jgi:Aerotolerance regulator N-terminal
MGLSFGNPLGFLALLGIPAVLAIHFLQRRSRQLTVSTLFLLEQLQRESEGGNRFERLRPSIPLWLQLLAVLVLTWLMVEPRWMEKNSVQQIVAVLDGSASMSVSRARIEKQLPAALRKLSSATAHTELYLLDSRRAAGHLYHGDSVEALMQAVAAWQPAGGTHDIEAALRLGRSLAGRTGTVIWVTDHDAKDLPHGARLLAAGEPEVNAGIAGVTVEEADGRVVWRAVLRNFSDTTQTREWWTESGGAAVGKQSVALPPNGIQSVQAAFADGQTAATLRLSPDKFTLDDAAPVVRPRPRQVAVLLPQDELTLPQDEQLYAALFNSLPAVTITADRAAADVVVQHYNPLDPALPDRPACIFVRDPRPEAPVPGGTLLVEKHRLTDNLNWRSLLVEDSLSIPAQPGDEALVWIGERPLLFLRGPVERRMLCFNFDLRKSNARRLPAFVIAIHRFLEDLRSRTVREEWRNVECGQKLNCPVALGEGAPDVTLTWKASGQGRDGAMTVPAVQAALLTAPDVPALLELRQADRLLLKAAAHFADVREADFTAAATRHDLDSVQATLIERHSREDAGWRMWLLVLLGLLAAAWYFISRPQLRRALRENA